MVFGIYCRKSVLSDKGESVENQTEMCRDYIFKKFGEGHEIKIYEDEGYSGKNTARPMFSRLTEDIKRKRVDTVVCYRLDRVSRNVSDFSALVELMNRSKVGFICIREEFDTTKPMGKAMMYIASVFSQLERETIGERVRDNMTMLARDGRWLGGNTPLGYEAVREPYISEDGRTKYRCRLRENNRLEDVRLIYELYGKYGCLSVTATELNRRGINTAKGGQFSPSAVRDILRNPVYCRADRAAFDYYGQKGVGIYGSISDRGIIAYNKDGDITAAVGTHAAAVSGADWTVVQRLLDENSGVKRSAVTGRALASGVIICGECGGKMYAVSRSGGRGFDYICKNKRMGSGCLCRNIRGDRADELIKKHLKEKEDIILMKREVRQSLEIIREKDKLIIKEKDATER